MKTIMSEILKNLKHLRMKSKLSVFDCSLIDLGKINFDEGNLTVVENDSAFPFNVKRVFYLYDIMGGESRGAHSHKECHQFLIAASGSFEVALDDGKFKRQIFLNRPSIGLHIPPGIWASEINFSSGAICLVLLLIITVRTTMLEIITLS